MSSLNSFFDKLYTNFLLRDILAKVIPGFLVLLYFFQFFPQPIKSVFNQLGNHELIIIMVLYGLSFMIGMLLQFLGTRKIWKWSLIKIYVHDDDQAQSLDKLRNFFETTKKEKIYALKEKDSSYLRICREHTQ